MMAKHLNQDEVLTENIKKYTESATLKDLKQFTMLNKLFIPYVKFMREIVEKELEGMPKVSELLDSTLEKDLQ